MPAPGEEDVPPQGVEGEPLEPVPVELPPHGGPDELPAPEEVGPPLMLDEPGPPQLPEATDLLPPEGLHVSQDVVPE
ncbi:MAG TPA: hypothetical protein VKA46_07720 [Gemmataceae bacterium]|nr:hypothetical protein [Gemmataceae bacterium]